jgi:hypothetical protein
VKKIVAVKMKLLKVAHSIRFVFSCCILTFIDHAYLFSCS